MTLSTIARSAALAATLLAVVSIAPARSAASPPAARLTAAPSHEHAAHCAHHAPLPAAEPLPGLSLYHLRAELTDQHGARLGLDAFRGHPVIVAMFYGSCTTVCPLLIERIKAIDAAIAPEQRAQTRVLLVSLDPERDGVERLAELAANHGVRDARWHLTRTSEASVREIAALLGVRYRRAPDGAISHSALVALLDRDGVVIQRSEGAVNDTDALARAAASSAR